MHKASLLSSIPANYIDKINKVHKPFLQKLDLKIKQTAVALFTMPVTLSIDLGTHLISFVNKTMQGNNAGASVDREIVRKCALGILATPLSLIFADIVSFHFTERTEEPGTISNFSQHYRQKASVFYPRTTEELQKILEEAKSEKKSVSIAGARFSQGEQIFSRKEGQIVVDLKHFTNISVNKGAKTCTVGAGVVWEDLHMELNKEGLSLIVQQASPVFSVGGTLSANAHGWDLRGNIARTVKSITYMDHAGNVLTATPDDEIFGCLVGGYGGFGIILDATLELKNNVKMLQKSEDVAPNAIYQWFLDNVIGNNDIEMFLYRLSLDPKKPLKEGFVQTWHPLHQNAPAPSDKVQKEAATGTRIQRIFLHAMRRFSPLISLFWQEEKLTAKTPQILYRNEVLEPAIKAIINNSQSEAEWLQEFFVPAQDIDAFLEKMSDILKENKVSLLNASVRYIPKDDQTVLSYAQHEHTFALVLCFHQNLSPESVEKTSKWIREATDVTLDMKGSYYLPYQPFPSQEQLDRSYPLKDKAITLKSKYDPENRFTNGLWEKYLKNAQKTA